MDQLNTKINARMFERIALWGIFVLCFMYSVFVSNFAEIHLSLSQLNFPVFIGECILLLCISMFFVSKMIKGFVWSWWKVALLIYAAWVLCKAFAGYYIYGPVSLRNAALFYYPIFFIFGFSFFSTFKFQDKGKMILMLLLAFVMHLGLVSGYFWYAYYIFFVGLIIGANDKRVQLSGIILLMFLLKFDIIFGESRSNLVGVVAALMYVGIFLISSFFKTLSVKKLIAVLLIFFGVVTGVMFFADKNAIKSISTFDRIAADFKEGDRIIQERKKGYVPRKLSTQIYNKNTNVSFFDFAKFHIYSIEKNFNPVGIHGVINNDSGTRKYRSIDLAYINILFRLYIWRDMLNEIEFINVLKGVSFGKPQRSESLELLNWGSGEWTRDGWITPHNSFLHYFYRGGIVGILIIIGIVGAFIYCSRVFLAGNSIIGCLMISVLIYWASLANFLVILELPYYAIPFWTLFGITFKYCQSLNQHMDYEV